jgi:hypothetical protein
MWQHKETLADIIGEQQVMEMVMEEMEQTEEISYEQQARPIAEEQSATDLSGWGCYQE